MLNNPESEKSRTRHTFWRSTFALDSDQSVFHESIFLRFTPESEYHRHGQGDLALE